MYWEEWGRGECVLTYLVPVCSLHMFAHSSAYHHVWPEGTGLVRLALHQRCVYVCVCVCVRVCVFVFVCVTRKGGLPFRFPSLTVRGLSFASSAPFGSSLDTHTPGLQKNPDLQSAQSHMVRDDIPLYHVCVCVCMCVYICRYICVCVCVMSVCDVCL